MRRPYSNAEWFDTDNPTEDWELLAEMPVGRNGPHAAAVLLADGTVLSAGENETTPPDEDATSHIFLPPYLFIGDQPVIGSAPGVVAYNEMFEVVVDTVPVPALDIGKVTLVRLAGVTHGFDMNQRLLTLTDDPVVVSDTLDVPSPANPNYAPPGYYMLFVVSDLGVPSVAEYVKLVRCLGDVDGDGGVGIVDFLNLLAAWGPCAAPCSPYCEADLDGDCNVGITDFLKLLAKWGDDCPFVEGLTQPPSLEEELDDACLDEDDWDEYVDVMTDPASSQFLRNRYDCWMRHYIVDCSQCSCQPSHHSLCAGQDPFN